MMNMHIWIVIGQFGAVTVTIVNRIETREKIHIYEYKERKMYAICCMFVCQNTYCCSACHCRDKLCYISER